MIDYDSLLVSKPVHWVLEYVVGTKAMVSERIESAHYESFLDDDFHRLLMQYQRPSLY